MTPLRLLAAGLNLVPVLLWIILGHSAWRSARARNLDWPLVRLIPVLVRVPSLHVILHAVFWLTPPELHRDPPGWLAALCALNDLTLIAIVAVGRHVVRFVVGGPGRAGAVWLAANYGVAALFAVFGMFLPLPELAGQRSAYVMLLQLYVIAGWTLILRDVARLAVRGRWRPGGASIVPRPADVVMLACGLLGACGFLVLILARRPIFEGSEWSLALELLVTLSFTVPFAVRLLGEVVRGFLLAGAMLLATGCLYFGGQEVRPVLAGPEPRLLLDLGTVAALVLLLGPGQAWLRDRIDRVILRRSAQRRAELQAFLHALSPEQGALECCRLALAEARRVMELRGVAILLRDGALVEEGACALGRLGELWPRDGAAPGLPYRALFGWELVLLPPPLREALLDTEVVGIAPVASTRGYRGHLFIRTGFLGATFSTEEVHAVEAFADQLARVLDGAELLARALEVERSLAHAEKLAAIGELAARMAHEIRNPVTAARSLAQQLAREPRSPLNAEHARLVVTELDRVEQQVRALLRFARRETYELAALDLSELARTTVEELRARLEAARVDVALDLAPGVVARADREKLRQVVINLVENALDALGENPNGRRLEVGVAAANGVGLLRVADNGPGIPGEALPRLFEPFFSLKAHGTGLGLAIAKRTVEAHGGRIAARSGSGTGMTVEVALPLVARRQAPT